MKLASHQAFTVAFLSGNLAFNCFVRAGGDIVTAPGHQDGEVGSPGGRRPDSLHHADQVGKHLDLCFRFDWMQSKEYQEGHRVVDPLEKTKEKEGAAVDEKSGEKDDAHSPDREVLPNQGSKDEEAEVDDPKDGAKLGGGRSFLGGLQGVEGGLEGGTEPNAGLRKMGERMGKRKKRR